MYYKTAYEKFYELFSVYLRILCMCTNSVQYTSWIHCKERESTEQYICFMPTAYSFCSLIDKQKRALGKEEKEDTQQKKKPYASHIERRRDTGTGKATATATSKWQEAHTKIHTKFEWKFCQSFRNVKWISKRNCMHILSFRCRSEAFSPLPSRNSSVFHNA